jgi:hypothetical protein
MLMMLTIPGYTELHQGYGQCSIKAKKNIAFFTVNTILYSLSLSLSLCIAVANVLSEVIL